MGIQIGRFLDNLFQNFCNDLAEYAFNKEPLRRAKRKLEFTMGDRVTRFFEDIWGGVVPSVILPESLTSSHSFHSKITEDSSKSSKKSKKAAAAAAVADIERVTSDKTDVACRLPKSKKFGDFFTPSKTELRSNCVGWPTFPHHLPPFKDVPMCIKFHTMGACLKGCKHAHTLPSAMTGNTWPKVKARIQKILGKS
jgi:hypothetical protein